MAFVNHKDRAGVVSELHLRRMPALAAPLRMLQTLRVVAISDRADETLHVNGVAADLKCSDRHVDARDANGIEYLWERQTEASTATIILPGAAPTPFMVTEKEEAAKRWIYDAPGEILRAILIEVVQTDQIAQTVIEQVGFDRNNLVSCVVSGGARFWSDFKLGSDGFGRLLVAANGMSPYDLGRTVQRFQELGNYRNLALLGLKTTQIHGAQLAAYEASLLDIIDNIVLGENDDDVLDALIQLAAKTTALNAQTAYRMSATEAYCEVALNRLHALEAQAVAGFQSLAGFTERRLLPAVKTCKSFSTRIESLAQRIERATAQLRTRVEVRIHHQNGQMLASMNENTSRQLQLQHLVEGLSVVGMSYYLIGLLSYMAKGVKLDFAGLDANQGIALATPVIIGICWLYLRRRMVRMDFRKPLLERPTSRSDH